MAQKAVLVTAANIEQLRSRFQADGTGVEPAIGYYLLAGFGEDGDYDMVSAANFNAQFTIGPKLRTEGFFEAIRKEV
jgi:hypothetical protein